MKNPEHSRRLFSVDEFNKLVRIAVSLELNQTELDSIGVVENHIELLLVDAVAWQEEIEAVHLEILQEKINNYIHFLESKQYVERYGDKFDKKSSISHSSIPHLTTVLALSCSCSESFTTYRYEYED